MESVEQVDSRRAVEELKELADLTGGPNGARRVAWNDEWAKAREWLRGKLREIGCAAAAAAAGDGLAARAAAAGSAGRAGGRGRGSGCAESSVRSTARSRRTRPETSGRPHPATP